MNWLFENREIKSIEDLPKDTFGFIYEVEHIPTGKKYLGKKVLYFKRNVKLGKKEYQLLQEERKSKGIGGRTPQKKETVKESDWKTYVGSNTEIKELLKQGEGLGDFNRTVLKCVSNKKMLTYFENKFLFSQGVIEPNSNYINDNIEGRYYRKDFQ